MTNFKSISAQAFKEKEKEGPIQLLDVREEDEFADDHIRGAFNVPLSTFNLAKIRKDKELYVICASGRRSEEVVRVLNGMGYNATNIEGGMFMYRRIK